MKMALLISASPKRSRGGPITRLSAGLWKFQSNSTNSKIRMLLDGRDAGYLCHDNSLTLKESTMIQAVFEDRGDENAIDIYAERVA